VTSVNKPSRIRRDIADTCAISRLRRVFSYVDTNVDRLDAYKAFWKDEDPFVTLLDKIVVETLLLLLIVVRSPVLTPELRDTAGAIARKVERLARSDRNRLCLLRFPHTACSLGMGHIALTALGAADDEFDVLVRRALQSGHVETVERIPFRSMEHRWLRGILDGYEPDFRELLPASALASRGAHPINMSPAEAYAVTHALFYLTDFGTRPMPKYVDVKHASALIDAGIAWCVFNDNFDIMVEYLMGALMLSQPATRYTNFAWQLVCETWDELDFLPCPSFEPAVFAGLDGMRASAYAFEHTYHTTYVAGMLTAIASAYPDAFDDPQPLVSVDPATRAAFAGTCRAAYWRVAGAAGLGELSPEDLVDAISASHPPNEVQELIYSALDREGGRTHYLQLWRFMESLSDRCIIADGILIDHAQQYSLVALARLLTSIVREHSCIITPTFVEAARFLLRQEVRSGEIGAYFLMTGAQPVENDLRTNTLIVFAVCLASLTSAFAAVT
jgi:hypothetical protein